MSSRDSRLTTTTDALAHVELVKPDRGPRVQRHAPAQDTRTHYAVIDRRGAVVAKVDVPNGGRIVGFGAASICGVRKDADDLQYLQRFPLR